MTSDGGSQTGGPMQADEILDTLEEYLRQYVGGTQEFA